MWKLILLFFLVDFLLISIILSIDYSKEIVFFDVGQGSAVLIKDARNTFLYDTGRYGYKVINSLRRNLPFFQKRIDVLFLSHADKDHYGGTFEILERYNIRYLAIATTSEESGFQRIIKMAKDKGVKIVFLNRGSEIWTRNLRFQVIHPTRNFTAKDNDLSLVLKILSNKNSVLLGGDIEKKAIKEIIKCCKEYLKSNIFLWPHHGSKYSLDNEFFNLVSPQVVIIQVGPNYYGHPHKEVLDFLKKEKALFLRTDIDGEIKFGL